MAPKVLEKVLFFMKRNIFIKIKKYGKIKEEKK